MTFLAVALVHSWLAMAQAQVWVDPYTRKDGLYLGGHYQSNRDQIIKINIR